jgi:outer membrane protein assembly factor BamB
MFRRSKMLKSMLFMLFLPILVVSCSNFMAMPPCELSDQYILEDSSFRVLWKKTDMLLPNCASGPLIQGTSSHVFVLTMPKYGSSMITALDSQTGAVLWEQVDDPCINILASDKSLYVGRLNKIDQYDPATGHLIDELVSLQRVYDPVLFTEFPHYGEVGLIYPMYFAGNKIFALAPGSGRSLIYDVDTKTLDLSRALLPYTPFVVENSVFYLHDVEGFKAEDVNTQKVLWKYAIDVSTTPLFADNVIIVPTSSNNIYILNKATGGLIAKVYAPHIISNLAQDTTRIYFLTEDGGLEVVDKTSGQVIQKISLSPVPFLLAEPGKIVGKYNIWVDSQNKVIVASFGASCQLVALKLTNQ